MRKRVKHAEHSCQLLHYTRPVHTFNTHTHTRNKSWCSQDCLCWWNPGIKHKTKTIQWKNIDLDDKNVFILYYFGAGDGSLETGICWPTCVLFLCKNIFIFVQNAWLSFSLGFLLLFQSEINHIPLYKKQCLIQWATMQTKSKSFPQVHNVCIWVHNSHNGKTLSKWQLNSV